jgi:replicative DNA helicase
MSAAGYVEGADPRLAHLKVPPHSLEAEQAVLGGLLLSPEAWFEVVDVLRVEDFFRGDHRLIWTACAELVAGEQPVDILTVRTHLAETGAAGRGVDVAYLAELLDSVPGVANIRAYAEIVRRTAQHRTVISAANRIADGAFAGQVGVPEAQAEIMGLDADRGGRGPVSALDAARLFVAGLDRRKAGGLVGMSTGLGPLDDRWGGMQPGQLIVIAGRPSMGKSALAMQIAHHVAGDDEQPAGSRVLVWSGEMSAEQIFQREISRRARIGMTALQRVDLDHDAGWERVTGAMRTARDLAIDYDDDAGQTIEGVCARARRQAARGGLRLLAVDYLQLLDQGGDDNQAERLGTISRALKRLAGELQVPVIALSQLNRALEQRTNKRPTMADLRGSGAIEQDADIVLGLYRDEVYNEHSREKGVAELITLKGRDIGIGTDRVATHLHRMSFEALADGWTPPAAPAAPEDDI